MSRIWRNWLYLPQIDIDVLGHVRYGTECQGIPSLAFLETVENVFESTEVKIVTTVKVSEMFWDGTQYQENEPFPQIEQEELCQYSYTLPISLQTEPLVKVQWIVCHAGSWNPKNICYHQHPISWIKYTKKLNATVLVEYIPRATVRIIIHVSVITERNRKSDEKPREEDYDE